MIRDDPETDKSNLIVEAKLTKITHPRCYETVVVNLFDHFLVSAV